MKLQLPDEDLEFQIARLELSPGDALVAQVDRPITDEAASRIRAAIERVIPKTKVLVIPPGMVLTVVGKADVKKLESAGGKG